MSPSSSIVWSMRGILTGRSSSSREDAAGRSEVDKSLVFLLPKLFSEDEVELKGRLSLSVCWVSSEREKKIYEIIFAFNAYTYLGTDP